MDSVERLYLDYNATSPLSDSVTNWLRSGEFHYANPSSQHSLGKASRKSINQSRSFIYSCFHQNEKEVNLLFHSGATEGVTTFAHSFSEWARLTGKDLLICYSKLDHPAVTSLSEHFYGAHVKFLELKMDQSLCYDYDANIEIIKDKKENNPDLIILYHHLWTHNETGIVSPLEEIKELKKISDLYIHVDAVQVPGKITDWDRLSGGDIFTFSAHKFGALKGIGFSFFKKSLPFYPLMMGGGQQSGLRSGTENPMGVHSIALALQDLLKVNVNSNKAYRQKLETFIKNELADLGEVVSMRGKNRNSNTIYFYFKGLTSDIALAMFDLHGLMISAGSACSSGASKASPILLHLGFKDEARNGLRLSFSFNMNEKELDLICKMFKLIVGKVRSSQE